MLSVLWLFMIPIGGGIPAGVVLAQKKGIGLLVTSGLYFISDVILAFLFEPVMNGTVAAGKRCGPLARFGEAFSQNLKRTCAYYGAGPMALIMVAFGVDPMTGRAAAAAAGHGFLSGWAIAITGDMMYFCLIMAATLKLSAALGDPDRAMWIVLGAMLALPPLIRRVKRLSQRGCPSAAADA